MVPCGAQRSRVSHANVVLTALRVPPDAPGRRPTPSSATASLPLPRASAPTPLWRKAELDSGISFGPEPISALGRSQYVRAALERPAWSRPSRPLRARQPPASETQRLDQGGRTPAQALSSLGDAGSRDQAGQRRRRRPVRANSARGGRPVPVTRTATGSGPGRPALLRASRRRPPPGHRFPSTPTPRTWQPCR